MAKTLEGKSVAILVESGFEQAELVEPRKALEQAGALTRVVSPVQGSVRAWHHGDWGEEVLVDQPLGAAHADEYDALLLPGGVMSPDELRMNPRAVAFVKAFVDAGKPIAAICHGPWTLIETGMVKGRRVTSWPSLRTDLCNAGAEWVDDEVVTDGDLVTSRKPADIPAFSREVVEVFAKARQGQRKAA